MCWLCETESLRIYNEKLDGFKIDSCLDEQRSTIFASKPKQLRPKERFDAHAFAMKLHKLRMASKLTQAEVAERANLNLRTISSIESGKRMPRIDTVVAIAEVLDVGVEDVLRA